MGTKQAESPFCTYHRYLNAWEVDDDSMDVQYVTDKVPVARWLAYSEWSVQLGREVEARRNPKRKGSLDRMVLETGNEKQRTGRYWRRRSGWLRNAAQHSQSMKTSKTECKVLKSFLTSDIKVRSWKGRCDYLVVLASVLYPLPLLLLLWRKNPLGNPSPRTSLTLLLFELIFPIDDGEDSLLDWELKLSDRPLPTPSGRGMKWICELTSTNFKLWVAISFSEIRFSVKNFGSRFIDFDVPTSASFSGKWIWWVVLRRLKPGLSLWANEARSWYSCHFSVWGFLLWASFSRMLNSGSIGTFVMAME